MSLDRTSETGEEESSNIKTGQLAKLITEVGPNISEIARRLGQYKESVRYRYKEKLLNKGFAVRVAVDHEKLGLRRVIMLMDFADGYRDVAELMLTIMSYEGYLVAFEKVLPDGRFLVHASVPDEKVEAYREFFGGLKEQGYFRSFEFYTFHWFRNAPMKTEMYDFDEGLWDFDWSTDAKVDRQAASYMPSAREKFDATDLKILKQLQMDGNRSLADMAETLKINYKTLTWHYRKHIEERKLIKGYVINWMGTKFDYKADKALNKKHTYLAVSVLFSDLDQAKRIDVMSRLNQLPFIWSEAVGDRYEAELIFPIESITEGLQLLSEVISETKTSARYFIIDQRHALTFSLIPELYDESRQAWQFNEELLLRRFENLLQKAKGIQQETSTPKQKSSQ
ncbi:MAG: winged helix-turn-helix domain-containing protein [Thaumarchaeota archaeon]|nr:winged helix-turn-helix domain-containing protein [Nitrososphaerota archaeon]